MTPRVRDRFQCSLLVKISRGTSISETLRYPLAVPLIFFSLFPVVLAGRRARCLGHGFFLFDIEVLHSTKGSEGGKKKWAEAQSPLEFEE